MDKKLKDIFDFLANLSRKKREKSVQSLWQGKNELIGYSGK